MKLWHSTMRHLLDDQPRGHSVTNLDGDVGDANGGQFGEKINNRSLDSKVSVSDLPRARRLGPEPDLSDDTGGGSNTGRPSETLSDSIRPNPMRCIIAVNTS